MTNYHERPKSDMPDADRAIRRNILARFYGMVSRCHDSSNSRYGRYGGRGIKVCDEWLDDKGKFIGWAINNGYKKELQIDRIDNDGNYEPDNCRWATALENMRNRSLMSEANELGYWGVCKSYNKWKSQVWFNGESHSAGVYETLEEAAFAYNQYVLDNNLGLPLNPITKEEVEEIASKRVPPSCIICGIRLSGLQRKFCCKKHSNKHWGQIRIK